MLHHFFCWCSFFAFFISFIVFLSCRISVWFFSTISISLLNSLCSYIVFLLLLNCPSIFCCSSLSFFKTAVLNFFFQFGKSNISMCFCVVTRVYCDPLIVSCYLDFFMFLDVLHIAFTWGSSHLLSSLLIAFGGEMPSVSPATVWGLLRPSVSTTALYVLFLCVV